jgi:hypothetical protein
LMRPYRARAKISLNNRLKSRFIRRGESDECTSICGECLDHSFTA